MVAHWILEYYHASRFLQENIHKLEVRGEERYQYEEDTIEIPTERIRCPKLKVKDKKTPWYVALNLFDCFLYEKPLRKSKYEV